MHRVVAGADVVGAKLVAVVSDTLRLPLLSRGTNLIPTHIIVRSVYRVQLSILLECMCRSSSAPGTIGVVVLCLDKPSEIHVVLVLVVLSGIHSTFLFIGQIESVLDDGYSHEIRTD